jgi:hypothetical protein
MGKLSLSGGKGWRGNNFTFFAKDFCCLPRNADADISGIFRGGMIKAGGEKTGKECEVIFVPTLNLQQVRAGIHQSVVVKQRREGMLLNCRASWCLDKGVLSRWIHNTDTDGFAFDILDLNSAMLFIQRRRIEPI